jgi:hypothetical protein
LTQATSLSSSAGNINNLYTSLTTTLILLLL